MTLIKSCTYTIIGLYRLAKSTFYPKTHLI